jgi:murein DD-endopeptidase MepM/ murein hydrolase activator NlpD
VDRRRIALAVTVVLVAFGPPAEASAAARPPHRPGPVPVGATPAPRQEWSPPVDGPVVRGYEPPHRPFGPQHLGLDYAVAPGSPVRAAGDGTVAFAGLVGRSRAVAIEHPGGRRTTYAYLRRVLVRPGVTVRRGDALGLSGADGPGHHADVVHFGYRLNGQPHDPAELFERRPPRISLAPLDRPACPTRRP